MNYVYVIGLMLIMVSGIAALFMTSVLYDEVQALEDDLEHAEEKIEELEQEKYAEIDAHWNEMNRMQKEEVQ
ncbi:hypothetical protein [Natribacillus halophilus]|uniref:Uncharacterized protein n=1 Tax=Natribacillus halophilus TaxID=549003 RepID=A0A1G8RU91_9BACI|nr:hypothetical protein [Natribacillus halophilus]SDJ20509.1 hypothetical protein SAMN04488123_12049 [Natribacillus halophilus]